MAGKDKIEQPNEIWKRKFAEVISAKPIEIEFRGKKRTIGWMHYGTYKKFAEIMSEDCEEWKRNVKLAAVSLMNVRSGIMSKLRTMFFYPIYWRWLYYVCDIDMPDVLFVLDAIKKKIQSEPFLMCTILVTGLMDEMMGMMMKAREVKAGQAEQGGDNSSR